MENDKVFWMVYVEGQQGPTKRHPTRISAIEEAERLCRQTCRRVFVLRADEYASLAEAPVDWTVLEGNE